jgi:RNA polymerase sigma-70 factor (ECF subfamily)
MAPLGDAYRAARLGSSRSPATSNAQLERVLADLHARGQAGHPDLPLDGATFAAHLGRCGAEAGAETTGAHAADLFLAAAALAGGAAAVARLRQSCWPAALAYLRRLGVSSAELDDVAQEMWNALLVGADGGAPKLAGYSGRGALAAFVGITAQRIAMTRFRHDDAGARAARRAAAEMQALAGDAELALIKESYRECFQQALCDALGALDDRARMLLRLHLVDGVSVERIGKAYGVGQSTASRWLAKGRDQVARETRRMLTAQLRLSDSDFDSLWGLMLSHLDVSLSRVLGHA